LASDAAPPTIGAVVVAGVLAVAAVYLLGRRRGRRRASVLEIRRI
jgi:membrane protein DedA with SNARE-associated domain